MKTNNIYKKMLFIIEKSGLTLDEKITILSDLRDKFLQDKYSKTHNSSEFIINIKINQN